MTINPVERTIDGLYDSQKGDQNDQTMISLI